MAPGGRVPSLPRGRLLGCMKAALLVGCMGGKWGGGGGGGGVDSPPTDSNKKNNNKI